MTWLAGAARASSAVLVALVAAVPLWAARPARSTAGATAQSTAQATAQEVDARDVYLRDCASCHGAEGRGTPRGPVLVGVGRASAHYQLTTGRMPLAAGEPRPRRGPPAYPAATVRALIDYVGDFGPGPAIPNVDLAGADVAQGGSLYRLQCAACHAWGGEGGALVGREAPPLAPATPTQIAEAVRLGPGGMPAFGLAALTPTELDSVVAYVEELDDPSDRGGFPLGHLGPFTEGAAAWVLGAGLLVMAVRWIGERS